MLSITFDDLRKQLSLMSCSQCRHLLWHKWCSTVECSQECACWSGVNAYLYLCQIIHLRCNTLSEWSWTNKIVILNLHPLRPVLIQQAIRRTCLQGCARRSIVSCALRRLCGSPFIIQSFLLCVLFKWHMCCHLAPRAEERRWDTCSRSRALPSGTFGMHCAAWTAFSQCHPGFLLSTCRKRH